MEATLEPRLVIPGASDTPAVSGTFVVPDYQRGYRWGRYEVRQLLDDLWDHLRRAEQRKELPSPYFLQPIVVLAREDNSWELIDGQQRLTTLFLLTRYIATRLPGANVRYTLTYETRKRQGHDSNRFLESLPAVEPDERHANVDFHHMALACDAIAEWFEERKNASQAAIDLHTALSKWVYVIWYEAPAGTDANSLFTRLNRDRIPLTDSELIKALVLARDGAAAGKPHRREEVAAQWDSFERDLHDPKLWAFLTGTVEERPTHIDFLFETMTQGGERHDRPRYQTFTEVWDRISGAPTHADSKPGAAAFWHDVVERHGLLTGWFHDRGLYHRIGYLVASGDSIRDLVQEAQPRTHSAFRTYLIERTRARLGLTEAGLSLLRYDHGSGREKCGQVLLLMNVETVLGDDGNVVTVLRDDAARGLFPFDSYSRQGWSLEHIHAQKAQQLRREPERRDWLRAYAGTITAQWPGDDKPEAKQILEEIQAYLKMPEKDTDKHRFEDISTRVFTMFSAPDAGAAAEDVHGLGNLALLQREFNSRLGNDVFAVKRQRILELDRTGAYLLPCTRNIFLKYYTSTADQQLSLWSPQDQDAYYQALIDKVGKFLLPDPTAKGVASPGVPA